MVGHHICDARQLFTCGFSNKRCSKTCVGGQVKLSTDSKISNFHSLGYANSPHRDFLDLMKGNVVDSFLNNFISHIRKGKKYQKGTKCRLIKKAREIIDLVGLRLPTTCAHNIVCKEELNEASSLKALFLMFDFAMTLSHKIIHNFCAWTFDHCTALPILIFNNGCVHISNDNVSDENCLLVVAWGRFGGNAESALKSRYNCTTEDTKDEKKEKKEEMINSDVCKRLINRLSMI